jgi:protein-disulfide isomerase
MREAREAEATRRRQRQRTLRILGIVVILGLLAAIGFVIYRAATGDDATPTSSGKVVVPEGADDDGGILVGASDAPVTVTLYYDYMCPACGAFEKANGTVLDDYLANDTIRMELHPISFLDKASQGTEYSTRAANAFATVVDEAPDKAWAFHDALYAHQPEENSPGLTDDEIAGIARDAGVPDSVVAHFQDGTYVGWVAAVTQKAFDSGIEGTPTILIDGKPLEGSPYEVGPLSDAIDAAAGKK